MTGFLLMSLGVLLLLSPAILLAMDGVDGDDDLVSWLMSKPLEFIVTLRAMTISGVGLIFAGAIIFYLPS